MASLKDSLNKGITAINLKTNNFVEESKCKTYISTLEKEIEQLKLAIGGKTYDQYKQKVDMQPEINQLLEQIDQKYAEIDVQRNRISQLAAEESQVLGNASASAEKGVFCSQCGAKNAPQYKFCSKCGAPLK
jgi:chromosome segregation ATPase